MKIFNHFYLFEYIINIISIAAFCNLIRYFLDLLIYLSVSTSTRLFSYLCLYAFYLLIFDSFSKLHILSSLMFNLSKEMLLCTYIIIFSSCQSSFGSFFQYIWSALKVSFLIIIKFPFTYFIISNILIWYPISDHSYLHESL